MCFKSMNKQQHNKKHVVFLRVYPCSSELTKRQQLSLWGKGMKTVSKPCWRDSKRRGNRGERKDYWSVPLIVPQSCFGRIGVEEAKLLQKRLKRQEKMHQFGGQERIPSPQEYEREQLVSFSLQDKPV